MATGTDWPLGEGIRVPATRLPAPARRRRKLPRVTWVLVAAAFACGALLSAAGFAVGWRHEAQRGSSAQTALAIATAHDHALTASLDRTRSSEAVSAWSCAVAIASAVCADEPRCAS